MSPDNRFAALIIESGKSLQRYRGKTLLAHAVERARDAGLQNVYVVLGANAQSIREELELPYRETVRFVDNQDWEAGVGSSIRAGMRALVAAEPGVSGVVLQLCDGPALSAASLPSMIHAFDAERFPVVASERDGALGVPALVGREFFEGLLELAPDAEVQSLFERCSERLTTVSVPEAQIAGS